MRGVFDDGELEPAQPRRDAELTLGATTLLAIFFGLMLICGLFFGLGYAVGRRGSQPPAAAAQPPVGASTALQAGGSLPKPSPAPQAGVASAPQTSEVNPPASGDSSTIPVANSQTTAAAVASGSPLGQPQVRPALPTAANPLQPAQPAAVQPAFTPPDALMVQIAVVPHPEDAEVLVNALRRRGYAVVARRELADNLIHVRIGPFSNRNDANAMRAKLLNDGYNAIVLP
jgi:cell division septation protein DedD